MLRRLRLPTQERIEASDLGRAVISAFLIVTLVSVIAVNMPGESRMRANLLKVTQPFVNASGLDQTWSVFAPNPRQTSAGLIGHVTYADGTDGEWRPPKADPFVGQYWDYRWRKWYENVILEARSKETWKPAAAFIARQERNRGRKPVEVTLVKRESSLRPPDTPGPDETPFRETPYYTLRITPEVLGEN